MPAMYLWICRCFLIGLGVFAFCYPYVFFSKVWPADFAGDFSWAHLRGVDDDVAVPFYWRLFHFCLYLPAVAATLAMIAASMRLTWLFLRGAVFDVRAVRAVKWVGLAAAMAGFFGMAGWSLEHWVYTAWNEEMPRLPLRIGYDSGEMGTLVAGLGVAFLAQILDLAAFRHRENQEIV